MAVRLKPLARQTIVITGASSGIGLATARMAAQRGAALVLVARDEPTLQTVVEDIRKQGGRAEYHVADVADRAALQGAADLAVQRFGGFDSWVNDAGVSVYGSQQDTPIEDQRRLFDTNYWGVVNGSLIAAAQMKETGGAIVNLGSVLSDRAMIYQGTYSATKHAVKGFTDSLRMELEADGAPVSVTLIKPAAINTAYPEHARNRMGTPGLALPPPTYHPRLVARAILFACENPKRDLYVGGGGAMISLLGSLFPRATDLVMQATGRASQSSPEPGKPERYDNLYEGRPGGSEQGSKPGGASRNTSLLLEAQMKPAVTAVAVLGVLALAAGAAVLRRQYPVRLQWTLPNRRTVQALVPRRVVKPAFDPLQVARELVGRRMPVRRSVRWPF